MLVLCGISSTVPHNCGCVTVEHSNLQHRLETIIFRLMANVYNNRLGRNKGDLSNQYNMQVFSNNFQFVTLLETLHIAC